MSQQLMREGNTERNLRSAEEALRRQKTPAVILACDTSPLLSSPRGCPGPSDLQFNLNSPPHLQPGNDATA